MIQNKRIIMKTFWTNNPTISEYIDNNTDIVLLTDGNGKLTVTDDQEAAIKEALDKAGFDNYDYGFEDE